TKPLTLLMMTALALGSANLLAAPDDQTGRPDNPGKSEERGNRPDSPGKSEEDHGQSRSRNALSADFLPIPPTKGKGYGQYFVFSGGDGTTLNADVRLALEKIVEDGDNIILNTHLGITEDNADEVAITVFIGTDTDGDGTCLTEGPTSMCVLFGGGGDDLVNEDGILHAAYAMSLREDDGDLRGSGICWSDFEKVKVEPQYNDDGIMTSVVFELEGGEEAMPVINPGDGTMVGFGAEWLDFDNIDCGADTECEVIPIMMGLWE
ncbi:MAG: hypothetical protein PVI52_10675, partial [Chromatiales bacterium]